MDKLHPPNESAELSEGCSDRAQETLAQKKKKKHCWDNTVVVQGRLEQLSLSLDLKVPVVASVWDFNWQCIPKSSLLALMSVWNCLLVYSLPL